MMLANTRIWRAKSLAVPPAREIPIPGAATPSPR
jgi:hypothetical protein